ncbi:MAG: hypothetical protein Q9183_004182 [Haloplaca sp. 2 TL-2023]
MNTGSTDSSASFVKSSVLTAVDGEAELAKMKVSADVPETDAVKEQPFLQPDETDKTPHGRSPIRVSRRDNNMHETAGRILDSRKMTRTEASLSEHDCQQESNSPGKTASKMIKWLEPDPRPEFKPEPQSRRQSKSEHDIPLSSPLRRDDSAIQTIQYPSPSPFRSDSVDRSSEVGNKGAHWKWLCQTDAIPGYWATSWWYYIRRELCIGIISVVLENLGHLHDQQCIHYYTRQQDWFSALNWARKGFSTWPSYARNARNGVVVEGSYVGVYFPGFTALLPRIVLAKDHAFQTQFQPPRGQHWDELRLAEIMLLDSWLSMAGRTSEIAEGRSMLLRDTPVLIHYLATSPDIQFDSIYRSANEGGLQRIREVASSLRKALKQERLSVAEQTFTLVALLRTAKVLLCVLMGPHLRGSDGSSLLDRDQRAWLV